MIVRPKPLVRTVVCALWLTSVGCTSKPLGPEADQQQGEGVHPNGIISAPTCFAQEPGCGCNVGTPPVTCTHTEERGELTLCELGAMYCVEGVWSECELATTWEIPRPKVITAPGACSPCNPDCFVTDDEPDQADITTPPPGISSTNVEFTLGPPRGIRPVPIMTTSVGSIDTDMDGVPDSGDDCPMTPGTSAFFGCPTGAGGGGFFHVLPPGATGTNPLTFNVALREADIYVLVDTTGSMGDEIVNLRNGLTTGVLNPACPTLTGVIGAIRCTIPDTWFGVGSFEDYPVEPYGSAGWGDLPYRNLLDLTPDTAMAQMAVNALALRNGSDIPESNSQALYAVASGDGLTYQGVQYLAPRTNCPAGRWGYPCFRPNVTPIVLMITDAASHNGPGGNNYAGTVAAAMDMGSQGDNNTDINVGNVNGVFRTYTGSTANAVNDKNDGGCNAAASRDRLFTFTVTTTATFTMETAGSAYDTVLFLYAGNSTADADRLACDDDGGGGVASRITRVLTPGTYTLRLDGFNNAQGNFRLGIGESAPGGVPYPNVIAAMNARDIRFIGVHSLVAGQADLNAIAVATGSLGDMGVPFTQAVNADGSGLSTAIVNAVVSLADFARMDVDVQAENVMLLPGVPASALLQSVSVGAPGCLPRCTGNIPNGCSQCLPNTNLPFSVTFANNVIMPTAADQVFNFDLIVRGNLGDIELQRVPVRIVVPGTLTATTFMEGRFSRTFNAQDTCEIPRTRPDWGFFNWEVNTPGDSSVTFEFRTAETEGALNTQMPVSYRIPAGPDVPTPAEYVDVGQLFSTMGGMNFLPFLRVTAVLTPSSDGTQAPTLTSMGTQYGCVDSE